jgi:hypothetical protein
MSRLTGPVMVSPATDSTTRHATAQVPVGTRAESFDGAFAYVTAGGTISSGGDPVSVAGGLDAVVRGDADVGAFLGIAEAAFASGESGFVRTKGPTTAVVESGAAAGDYLELSDTVGKLEVLASGVPVAIALEASDDDGVDQIDIYVLGR